MTVEPFDWFPARYQPHGSTAGEGAQRLLGTPSHDPLTVLVRETVQNSWDARKRDSDSDLTSYHVGLRTLTPEQTGVLRDVVFPHRPVPTLDLEALLGAGGVRVLQVDDRGTTGLGGPVRADREPDQEEPTDFIDFVFNIGAPRDTHLGGGTYGFGKTIAYVVSRPRTILILSRAEVYQRPETRVIGAAITDHFAWNGDRFTGRQWWGRMDGDRIAPVTGSDAEKVADVLDIEFDGTGTTILIIDPDLRGLSTQEAGPHLRDALLWHVWPKFLPRPGETEPSMRVSASVDGVALELSDPREVPGLAPFAASLQWIRHRQDGTAEPETTLFTPHVEEISWGRARVPTGHLAMIRSPIRPGSDGNGHADPDKSAYPLNGTAHHVALMRQPELIVEYVEGPPSAYDGYEWAGVFRCVDDVDDHFAAAEPPAHDLWEWQSVDDDRGRSYVRTTLRKINTEMREFAAPSSAAASGTSRRSAAAIADQLWAVVPNLQGTGAEPEPTDRSLTESGASRPSVELGRTTTDYDEGLVTRIELTLERDENRPVDVSVSVGVATDTGTERSAPRGSRQPRLREVRPANGGPALDLTDGFFRVGVDAPLEWTLTVESPEPSALRISVQAIYPEA